MRYYERAPGRAYGLIPDAQRVVRVMEAFLIWRTHCPATGLTPGAEGDSTEK